VNGKNVENLNKSVTGDIIPTELNEAEGNKNTKNFERMGT